MLNKGRIKRQQNEFVDGDHGNKSWNFFTDSSYIVLPNFLRKHSLFLYIIFFTLGIVRNGFSIFGQKIRDFNSDSNLDSKFQINRHFVLSSMEWIGLRFGGFTYILLVCIIFLVFYILLFYEIRKFNNSFKRKIFFLITISPAITIVFQRFGSVDTPALFAGILGVLSKSKFRIFIYALIFAGTHSEAACIGGISLLIYQFGSSPKLKDLNKLFPAILIMFSSVIAILGLLDPDGRTHTLQNYVRFAIAQDLASGTLIIFSWFGCLWLLVVAEYFQICYEKKIYLAAAIGVGGFITLFTSDGTRVPALTLTPLLVALLSSKSSVAKISALNNKWFLVFLMTPTINVSNFNLFLPFHQILYIFNVASPMLVTIFK